MSAIVRALTEADDDAVMALNNVEVPRVTALDREKLLRYGPILNDALAAGPVGDPDGFCWTVGPGTAYWSPNYRWVAGRFASFVYLDRVVVAPRARGHGVARAMYDEVVRRAEGTSDWLVLEVNTRPRNEESLAFHAALGFEEVARQQPYGDDTEVAYLARPIAGPAGPT